MNTKELILNHYKTYPELEVQDLFKFLYQSSFGCEHLISNPSFILKNIQQEMQTSKDSLTIYEELDGDYVRLHLNCGLEATTMAKLFVLSSAKVNDAIPLLEHKLHILLQCIQEQELPFQLVKVEQAIQKWKKEGYPALHHSKTFNDIYHPAYRLVKKEYIPFLPIFKYIDQRCPSIVSIDGRCASGKTTLSSLLSKIYDCNVFHMDDFFLQPFQRTAKRFNAPGENVDHERFEAEVLIPLSHHQDINLRKFDCSTFTIQKPIQMVYKPLNIIEGSYSMHSKLQSYYDYSIFLTLNKKEQIFRLQNRNPEKIQDFIQKWIPLEENYFQHYKIQSHCSIAIDTSKNCNN